MANADMADVGSIARVAQRTGAIVVTGASSGIGRALVLFLARRGWSVFGGVRTPRDAEDLVVLAGARGLGALVRPIMLDVTEEAGIATAVRAIAATLEERGDTLEALINNAGIAVAGPIEEVPLARLREILAVNVVGVVAVTQAFLPLLRESRGRIINISSVSGRMAAPFLGPYAASKFALEALSDSLRVEMRHAGIRVVLIEPGPIDTPIWAKTETTTLGDRVARTAASPYDAAIPRVYERVRRASRAALPPDRVGAVVVVALTAARPRARYVVTRRLFAFALLVRLMPDGVRDWLFARGA